MTTLSDYLAIKRRDDLRIFERLHEQASRSLTETPAHVESAEICAAEMAVAYLRSFRRDVWESSYREHLIAAGHQETAIERALNGAEPRKRRKK